MAWLEGPAGVLAWQIDHNGSWRAEPADRYDNRYVLLAGHRPRAPVVAVAGPGGGVRLGHRHGGRHGRPRHRTGGAAPHRRTVRRPHSDNAELPVVFNDFMNGLMGDPSAGALLPPVAAG
ncbi:MAG: hypothetical protein HOY76_53345 [Streptomyces sp.]|nr:hypothetical protein [Streptomyces sp.]NUS83080.1 hypothetical protein [Streptomyces sp.]